MTKRQKDKKTKNKKRVLYCDVRAVSHSCDVYHNISNGNTPPSKRKKEKKEGGKFVFIIISATAVPLLPPPMQCTPLPSGSFLEQTLGTPPPSQKVTKLPCARKVALTQNNRCRPQRLAIKVQYEFCHILRGRGGWGP